VRVARSLVLAAWLCGGATAALAQAPTRQEAAEHFKRATAAEKDGRHQEAIDEYLLAYTLVPHADVLYNIGVNYEALKEWARAVEYYQRYLDERSERPSDADAVAAKIRELRTRIPAPPPPVEPPGTGEPGAPPGPPAIIDTPPPPPYNPLARWHAGLSYGLGVGDAPVERFLGHAGMRFGQRFDIDGIVGAFGKNDYALGVMGRLLLSRINLAQPFVRAAVTIGYAKQDASSGADTRFPVGFEAGGGLQIGARGKIEVDAVVRWIAGGWDAAATTADSYVNDTFAFAFDVGVVVDFAIISGVR
jgi:tetratricopeptide (TPR) repeat protein